MQDDPRIDEVLEFWFGEPDEHGLCRKEKSAAWWKKDPDFDQEIGRRFGALRREILAGSLEAWRETARGLIAYVVVLDQFSRNLGRGTAVMFEADARARDAACAGIDAGLDAELPADMRVFLYMPLMHSEALADQDRCVALLSAMHAQSEGPVAERLANNVKFAHAHREIIARFGRFPHRNEQLGRETTPAEAEFLKQPGSSF